MLCDTVDSNIMANTSVLNQPVVDKMHIYTLLDVVFSFVLGALSVVIYSAPSFVQLARYEIFSKGTIITDEQISTRYFTVVDICVFTKNALCI